MMKKGKRIVGENKMISPTLYRKKGKAVVETNSKIDFGERTCSLYLGFEVKMYNVGVMLKETKGR